MREDPNPSAIYHTDIGFHVGSHLLGPVMTNPSDPSMETLESAENLPLFLDVRNHPTNPVYSCA